MKLLLELGADPSVREPTYGATPLGWANHNHQRAVVEVPLPFADLFDAIERGGVARVAELLRGDPSLLDARNGEGKTPLEVAERVGAKEISATLRRLGVELAHRRRPPSP